MRRDLPMKQTKSNILVFDIEMTPSLAWVWSSGKQYVSYSNILEPQKIICISYKWLGTPGVTTLVWSKKQDERKMLEKFSKIADTAETCIAHNGKNFDIKQINARLAYHNLQPLSIGLMEDTLTLSRKQFRIPSHSLAYLAKYFKVGKKFTHSGGQEVWLKVWLDNDQKSLEWMKKRCEEDVKLLEAVYVRLRPYLQTTAVKKRMESGRPYGCPACGGPLHGHGTRLVSKLRKVARYRCQQCAKVVLGGVNLFSKTNEFPR